MTEQNCTFTSFLQFPTHFSLLILITFTNYSTFISFYSQDEASESQRTSESYNGCKSESNC